jgi:hypothetical protein
VLTVNTSSDAASAAPSSADVPCSVSESLVLAITGSDAEVTASEVPYAAFRIPSTRPGFPAASAGSVVLLMGYVYDAVPPLVAVVVEVVEVVDPEEEEEEEDEEDVETACRADMSRARRSERMVDAEATVNCTAALHGP